ncbi:multidrug resistance protein 1 [[Candida] anglica]|uniref:Multidrug resistance protein 1 n=1 Tax=[Candida] anglica TaxID=148631 RepID=A0ABP0E9W0_9ASCO
MARRFINIFIRDSFWGRLTYHLSSHKLLNHKEDRPDYVIPEKYLTGHQATEIVAKDELNGEPSSLSSGEEKEIEKNTEQIIVDWDGDDDPENPYNWPFYQKAFFIFEIAFLTTTVYLGSAIYTPGIEQIRSEWGIGRVLATLPLTLFVIGYGIGPMVLSPLSENAVFGRTNIYIITLFIFFILQIPTALAPNIASLCVLRFLGGFFASPALATSCASVGDVISLPYIPVGIAIWSIATVCGPSLGPLIGSVFAQLIGWRWTFWFMVIITGACFLILGFFLPETYSQTLLYRKAKRLRAVTGNQNIISEGEIANSKLTTREVAIDILWRPFEITIFEPVVLLINIYIALVYSIIYIWFEAFPIVFLGTYKFNLIEMGVTYVGIMIGNSLGLFIYIPIIYQRFTKKILAGDEVTPESFLPMAIFGSILMPIGILIFGWSASPDTHWIGAIIGTTIFSVGCFCVFQTLFNYLSMSFWRYLASVFASNDLFRSVSAGAFPLFGAPLFNNLGSEKYPVGWGSTLLALICVLMIAIPVLFYLNGPKLRARSKYSGS